MPAETSIPRIGFGTFGLTGEAGLGAMRSAIAASGIDRGAFFVTTKATAANLGRLEASIDDSLAELGLDCVDLVLIHWPAPGDDPPVRAYIDVLARAQDRGRTRLIGVSNFARRHVDEAIAEIGPGRLATNQVKQHVFLQNRVLAEHCRAAGIAITAYMPLAGGRLGDAPALAAAASRHGAEPSQVALAHPLARGSIVIPKAAAAEHQRNNLAADVVLDAGDLAALAALDAGRRHVDPDWGPSWD